MPVRFFVRANSATNPYGSGGDNLCRQSLKPLTFHALWLRPPVCTHVLDARRDGAQA